MHILGFAVLSNHLHVVVRTQPDIVKACPDDEAVLRWWRLFPQRRNEEGTPAEPTEFELNVVRNDNSGLKGTCRLLTDISWFMHSLAELIARRADKHDPVSGRFWEDRFRAQILLDETAIAACMAYVDLNPVRAGVAATPETSDFTSMKEPTEDRARRESVLSCAGGIRSSVKEDDRAASQQQGLSVDDSGTVFETSGLAPPSDSPEQRRRDSRGVYSDP